ncbi:MAG TPA: hypothetical protein VFG79_06555 [Solirubrobacter sp.]|nr:hypothetical protein [Solirubrobacter sp.]
MLVDADVAALVELDAHTVEPHGARVGDPSGRHDRQRRVERAGPVDHPHAARAGREALDGAGIEHDPHAGGRAR